MCSIIEGVKLLEYEAKTILKTNSIPVPIGTVLYAKNVEWPEAPIVLKSQVPIGGRGKLGGIRIVKDIEEAKKALDDIFKLEIKSFKPTSILAEEVLDIEKEFYLSLLVDRDTASIRLMANLNGGIEVEENHDFQSWELTPDNHEVVGQKLADYYGLVDKTFVLQDLIQNIYRCFIENDATLIEINPLVLTNDGKLVAGDCKMELDDAAAFRHLDWDFEYKPADSNFVTLNEHGTVATIANGAGLAMATVDAVADAGLSPANFLDIGGGANESSVLAAFEQIVEYPNVSAIVINIFAGITRCDEVAKAIITASQKIDNLPKLYIRLAGTNYQEAEELLKAEDIPLLPSLEACLQAVKEDGE